MKKLLFLFLMIISVSLISCESTENIDDLEVEDEFKEEEISTEYILRQAAEKVDLKSISDEDKAKYGEFLSKIQVFSAKLTESIYARSDKTQNLAVSPVSIYMALAMQISNSSGVAETELLNAVGVTKNEVVDFTKFLYSTLKKEIYRYDDEKKEDVLTSVLDLNNSIWIDKNVELKASGLDNLANNFHSDAFYVPFKEKNQEANELLSKYISNKTRGLIKPQLQLSRETLFAIVNTLYLKDCWDLIDDLQYTTDKYNFTCSDGSVVEKNLLQSKFHSGQVYETEKYNHFYVSTSSGFKLKFIVPNDGYSVSDVFTSDTILEVNNIKDYRMYDAIKDESHITRVLFPAFEAGFKGDLIDILKEDFGVYAPFDFGYHVQGLTDEEVCISDIIHQAILKVDEKGIEGAAVTIIANAGTSAMITVTHEMVIDKAFGFVLTDSNNNILFSGVINKA